MNTGEVNQPREDVKAVIMESSGLREDVKALITENKHLRDEMAEKQSKSDAEMEALREDCGEIKAAMKKLTQANELKCKFVFQLISFHPTLNDYFFPVLVK